MQATHLRAFALKNSGFDAFLYAEVGMELNGSTLTILSVLARLGQDPWKRAADWAELPRAAAIDDLSQSIAQMPLMPAALAGSRDIAARLVQLLPGMPLDVVPARAGGAKPAGGTPNWFTWCSIVIWMLLNVLLMHKSATDGAVPVERPMPASGPTATAPTVPVLPTSQERTSGG
ncbi:hypothetical protein G3T14_21475 [Methylobacterium sp. BTF04]|uniref:hypothetical protein n=1 Tax=Methylobacterium sp. BTF04 TaxID=2708300 RepID=UPI0013D08C4B|nr:hypothetical protein [Methylobacterium sp. BTF04]NEU14658.1 hypothetical protein [Methylobacterium sp. BTF04]